MRHWAVVIVVVVVGCSSLVWGQGIGDIVFYDTFESGDTSGWWAPARVGKTGQTTCYDEAGTVIDCAGTGQDGDIQPGVAWPNPRFVDNADGTVTDMLTGLVWLKNASCFGSRTWTTALADANTLASTACGLTDGSVAGDWHLPSVDELFSLVNHEFSSYALSNTAGTGQWSAGDPFEFVDVSYWSSTSDSESPAFAFIVVFDIGRTYNYNKTYSKAVWPVRSGQ